MEHKITNVQERNEWGDQMKDYAIALEGQQGWIKLTQKVSTPPPRVGETIKGRIESKTNRNGKSYLKFTKERDNPMGGSRTGGSQEAYIVQMLEELTGRRAAPDIAHPSEEVHLNEDPFEGMGI